MKNPGISPAMLRTGRLLSRLISVGLPMGPLRLLETKGRRTRQLRATPVALTSYAGETWLVSPFGVTDWVHNVRTRPEAQLVGRLRRRKVRLEEVDHETAAPILQVFRRSYQWVPFIAPAFDADQYSNLAAFRAEADRHPVFRIMDPAAAQS